MEQTQIELHQSKYQDMFSRGYELVCYLLWGMVITVAFAWITRSESTGVDWSFFVYALGPVLPMIYFGVRYKSGTKTLILNDEGFTLLTYNEKSQFSWSDFRNYKISRSHPYDIIILNSKYGKTEFSYYAFDKQQRQQLFEILDAKLNERRSLFEDD
ncbi:hypothetical protein [Ferrimonas aestuarii]|uniref:YcxB-like protein n=1 Tax=Ferrimonas aestuarii TaxID=2569539 RepID=A0A4U1BSI9_9GAMM|nr:hypothetical protein [Ferrimonas aestuarii]TKB55011.1 hypothetical protein FCL42_10630 [Ferrimonas aestuarii]